ncbi:MAG: diguanylate cyclase [Kaiparowitsia implicata GSE-PSE-MK54-09C]|nr:diguanylate cyclase [Kaiparowitsia implicata GSE-PSE-MK54-09C]
MSRPDQGGAVPDPANKGGACHNDTAWRQKPRSYWDQARLSDGHKVPTLPIIQLESVRVTVSIGAAALSSSDLAPSDLIQRADTALYNAKNGGRNRVAA